MKKRYKTAAGFSLLVLALVVVNLFLGTPSRFFDSLSEALVVTVLVSFIMMIAPAILLSKKKMEFRKGLMVCILNSLIVFGLFSIYPIVTIVTYEPSAMKVDSLNPIYFARILLEMGAILAVIYCFANMCFWVEPKGKVNRK